MKKILVAIPNFNNGAFIRDAIYSVLNQQLSDDLLLDIRVFDNASTDDSVNVVEDIATQYSSVTLMVNDTNVGAIANHNLCLEYAISQQYDFLKILSSDDVLIGDIIFQQAKFLVENRAANLVSCSMIISDENLNNRIFYSFVNDADTNAGVIEMHSESIMFDCMNKTNNFIGGPSNFMIRIEAIEHIRFSKNFRWLSDLQFSFDILNATNSSFFYFRQPGFIYRRHGNTDSASISSIRGLQTKEWLCFIKANRGTHKFFLRRIWLISKLVFLKLRG